MTQIDTLRRYSSRNSSSEATFTGSLTSCCMFDSQAWTPNTRSRPHHTRSLKHTSKGINPNNWALYCLITYTLTPSLSQMMGFWDARCCNLFIVCLSSCYVSRIVPTPICKKYLKVCLSEAIVWVTLQWIIGSQLPWGKSNWCFSLWEYGLVLGLLNQHVDGDVKSIDRFLVMTLHKYLPFPNLSILVYSTEKFA